MNNLVVGVDFGTSGVRALLLDAISGEKRAVAASSFPQWEKGCYCDPSIHVYRQHPAELVESFNDAVSSVVAQLPTKERSCISAISVDTTGSSPTAIGADGLPLSFSPGYLSDPDAMVILWKDHSSEIEAQEISSKLGKHYSSEWFWAKILHVLRNNPEVAADVETWAEHADWFSAYLCDNRRFETWKRCRSGAAHKALWNSEGPGYPPRVFFERIDRRLASVVNKLGNQTWDPGETAGRLSAGSANRTGLPGGIPVCVGSFDAHTAAIAGGIRPGTLVKIIGTSSSDMVVTDLPYTHGFPGVESVAEGTIVPKYTTIESGQAAYGDLTGWLVGLLSFTLPLDSDGSRKKNLYQALENAAEKIAIDRAPIALDWLNGRRSPGGDLNVRAALRGLSLGTSAPELYFSMLEAAAFGTRAVHEHLVEIGIPIDRISVLGGVADRSQLAMQVLADVLNRPLSIKESTDASAHGAAIYASVAGGVYSDLSDAQSALQLKERKRVKPNPVRGAIHNERYKEYQALAGFQSPE